MAKPTLLQRNYTRMARDVPRHLLGRDVAYNLVDYVPGQGAPLRKRGGWSYSSNAFGAGTYAAAVAYAPFTGGAQICAIGSNGNLYTHTPSSATVTDRGAAVTPKAPLAFHRQLLIITANNGTSTPKKWSGSALADLGGTPPAGQYGGAYKDRTLLANTSAQPQRCYFSGAGNPESWDTTYGFIDATFPIKGIATMRNALLLFGDEKTERIRGATPPPGTDMLLEPLFDFGVLDARSIVSYGENVFFANAQGIFMTDGALPVDLTRSGGMSQYWESLMSGWTSTWTIASGVINGHLVVSVMDGTTFKDCLVCDIETRAFFRWSNVKSLMFARSAAQAEELYVASLAAARVNKLSSVFAPSSSVKNDADGTAVAPYGETKFFLADQPGLKRVRYVYFGYDCRDAATDNPIQTLSFVTSPESTSYTALTPTLAETSAYARQRVPVRRPVHGIGFKFAQSNASSDTRIYDIEVETQAKERSRR